MRVEDVKLTHPERVLFEADGITKGELVAYYRDVAERMVPHLKGRPLSLQRFRASVEEGGFFQQNASKYFPDYVARIEVERADGSPIAHPSVDNAAALVYLANQGTVTFHGWGSRLPDLDRPDRLVLDLDPADEEGDNAFDTVRNAALQLKEILDEKGLTAVPMTTGSRGVHVIVPLDETSTWDEVWPSVKEIGAALVKRAPKEFTRAFYKSQRRGRLYVDEGRARRGHTAVVPWTVRGKPGAPVATPISWDELEQDEDLRANRFTIRNVLERPADPWDGAFARPSHL